MAAKGEAKRGKTIDNNEVHQLFRRVSSTHRLQDLLDEDSPAAAAHARGGRTSLFFVGFALVLGAFGLPAYLVASLHSLSTSASRFSVSDAHGGLPERAYWGLLLPCIVFVFILFLHGNWLAFKLFKHNL